MPVNLLVLQIMTGWQPTLAWAGPSGYLGADSGLLFTEQCLGNMSSAPEPISTEQCRGTGFQRNTEVGQMAHRWSRKTDASNMPGLNLDMPSKD